MTDDPRDAKTLGEACDNGDGTYNGLRALSWLSGVPLEDVKRIADEALRKRNKMLGSGGPGKS